MIFVYGFVTWLVFMVTAVCNGIFRERALIPRFGDQRAHILSTLLLSALLLIEIAIFVSIAVDGESSFELLALGAMWLVMTLAFEFGFGRFVAGKDWSALLHDYNVFTGRIWPLVLLVVLLGPLLLAGLA